MTSTVDEKIDKTLQKFEREDLFNDIRAAVRDALEDGYEDTNAGLERVENTLSALEKKIKEIEDTVSETRKLVRDEFMKISEGIALLAGIHDV